MSVCIPSEEDERTQGRTHTKLENKARHSTVNTRLSNRQHRHGGLGGQRDGWLVSVLSSLDMEENLSVKGRKTYTGFLACLCGYLT